MQAEAAPQLDRTSAEIRDRAVADANQLRQENAEIRELLRRAIGNNTWRDADLVRARQLLGLAP